MGASVCKLDQYKETIKGYIAMLTVHIEEKKAILDEKSDLKSILMRVLGN